MMSIKERIRQLKEGKEKGAVLVTAIIILTLLELLGFALMTMSEIDMTAASNLAKAEASLYAAEQGVMMGIKWTVNNQASLIGGSTVTLTSDMFQGKIRNLSNAVYPATSWSVQIKYEGKAGLFPGQSTEIPNFRYRLESNGSSFSRATRTIEVEFAVPWSEGFPPPPDEKDVKRKIAYTQQGGG